MRPASLDEIRTKALELSKTTKSWHFHILNPNCIFNDRPRFAALLECPGDKITLVYYSDQAEKDLGQEIVKLLHGKAILNKHVDSNYRPSADVQIMLDRISVWNSTHITWHHHMLFPDCRFNKHRPRYALLLENDHDNDILESLTDIEPTNDLKQIERSYYKIS